MASTNHLQPPQNNNIDEDGFSSRFDSLRTLTISTARARRTKDLSSMFVTSMDQPSVPRRTETVDLTRAVSATLPAGGSAVPPDSGSIPSTTIIYISVGASIAFIALLSAAICICRYRRRKQLEASEHDSMNLPLTPTSSTSRPSTTRTSLSQQSRGSNSIKKPDVFHQHPSRPTSVAPSNPSFVNSAYPSQPKSKPPSKKASISIDQIHEIQQRMRSSALVDSVVSMYDSDEEDREEGYGSIDQVSTQFRHPWEYLRDKSLR
ncbi:hypothetical protein BCR33DRAFT_716376 [Rhizoclosmatium globosum]|uniref:Uncharacterized protein n=1 Tax=Rhizoclosmatium globosum TaxID=329046 RepID=A0A1Y2CFE0_9FUNG|nr:hypothetical protein BCR33DRAFT_716376 [Rhizoclosmatium globosum]|eukprot:ORY45749.1 hypothetical protein BCR33DRAFT_716376 [Rhizoclosmatium globosum]